MSGFLMIINLEQDGIICRSLPPLGQYGYEEVAMSGQYNDLLFNEPFWHDRVNQDRREGCGRLQDI